MVERYLRIFDSEVEFPPRLHFSSPEEESDKSSDDYDAADNATCNCTHTYFLGSRI